MSMLTIKHVEDGGHESIRMAHTVSFNPKGKEVDNGASTPTLEAYGCTGDGGAVVDGYCCYGSGKVYVMNDAGSTVGNYDLN